MLNSIPLKIHCWGGLGSQLYAWALYEELEKCYPEKKLILVLHSSGVSRRVSELGFLSEFVNFEIVDDFSGLFGNNSLQPSKFSLVNAAVVLRKFIKKMLTVSRVVLFISDDQDLRKIKFWTISLRGDYSYRLISEQVLLLMQKRSLCRNQKWYDKSELPSTSKFNVNLHIRIGDLLTISSKNPIDFARIQNEICYYIEEPNDKVRFLLASDSIELAKSHLSSVFPGLKISSLETDTWSTIGILSSAKIFIGTNSKISVWVAILMFRRDLKSTVSLPVGASKHLLSNLSDVDISKTLRIY